MAVFFKSHEQDTGQRKMVAVNRTTGARMAENTATMFSPSWGMISLRVSYSLFHMIGVGVPSFTVQGHIAATGRW